MHRLSATILALVLTLGLSGCGSSGPARPNVVLIVADDMGYSDLGSYGGEIDTRHLDSLARHGLRFTQFYNTSRCCPTRASLMTGLYPHRAGVGGMTFDRGLPGYRGHLTDEAVTVARVLGEAGYRTGMVGKWHLSVTEPLEGTAAHRSWLANQEVHGPFSAVESYPVNRGFDDFYGNIWGVVNYFDPFSLVDGERPVESVPEDYYHTDAINDSAAAYVRRYAEGNRPFFLYVAHTAPHWPLHAPEEAIEKYEGTYDAGWSAVRRARYRRMVEIGIVDSATAPLPDRIAPERRWAANPDSVWDARAMTVHAAMVDRMDRGIGRILRALEETGEMRNTLILFLSDNGASPERPSEYGPGFDRPGETREGETIRYPTEKEVLPGPETVFAGIGPKWANVANAPFRYWKATEYEGGVATPLIAHWPAGIEVRGGTIVDAPGHVTDVMATLVELGETNYPSRARGTEITPTEGRSLVPLFEGSDRSRVDTLYFEHQGRRAVRAGDWKAVAMEDAPWELYDLSVDRTETRDLADAHPDRLDSLTERWERWARENQVLPRP